MCLDSLRFQRLRCVFFFNDTATTEIYTLSLHDALPISPMAWLDSGCCGRVTRTPLRRRRSEEHTSELQSPCNLVCRLLLEKKKDHGPVEAHGHCVLGYRRLAGVDPATGDPPVANERGDVVSVFNGELYNFRVFLWMIRRPASSTLFPYTSLFR